MRAKELDSALSEEQQLVQHMEVWRRVILKIYEKEYVFRVLWDVTLLLIEELVRLEEIHMREKQKKRNVKWKIVRLQCSVLMARNKANLGEVTEKDGAEIGISGAGTPF